MITRENQSNFYDVAMFSEMPEGWASVRLGDGVVADMQPGFACGLNNREGQGIAQLRPMNVSEDGRIDLVNLKYIPESEAHRKERLIQEGDVVFNNTNSPELVGKTAYYDLPEPRAFSNHMTRIRCRLEALDPHFCAIVLHQKWREGYFQSVCNNHVSQSSVSRNVLQNTPILLPPLPEQKRIVTKLDELIPRVNGMKERLGKAETVLKRFRQSVLAAACSGRLTADWREKHPEVEAACRSIQKLKERNRESKLRRDVPTSVDIPEELTEYELPPKWTLESTAALLLNGALIDVKDGNHGSNHPKRSEFSNDGCAFITAAQVKNYRIDYDSAPKVSGEPLKRLRVGFAEIGDAILTHKGSVGRAALNTHPCVLTPQTTYYRCNPEVLDSHYLVYFHSSPQFFLQLAAVMSQTTRDFVPISEQYHMFILLPPLEEQREIVRRVELMFKLADTVEERVAAATTRGEKLTQAIVAKAFRGELVPSEAELARREDRSYESASELLSRIKSERAANQTSQKARRDRH